MLTPNALERATQAFRRGYRDGSDLRQSNAADYQAGTFAREDYLDGYKAGQNDRKWNRS